jgi:outer membrane lipoprotein-sorting protein
MRSPVSATAVLVAALVFSVAAVQAQTVDEIIAKNLEAKGGADVLKSTTSVRTTGSGTMQGAEVSIVSYTKRPNFMRNEMTLGALKIPPAQDPNAGQNPMAGQKMIQGFDGQTLWLSAAGMPAQALPPGPQTDAMKQSSQIDSPLLDYKDKGTTIQLGEPATEEGHKLHHLIVTPKGAPTMHYYIDADTNLEHKMVIDVEEGAQKMTMEMRFSDYRKLAGRTVPMTVTQFVNGRQVGQLKYEKVEFDVPMEESLFRMPK